MNNTKLKFDKDKIITAIFFISIFIILFVFYKVVCPIIPNDTDDWGIMSHFREPIPLWKDWNPSRVFPEIFLPLILYFTSYIVMPFNNDFIESLSFTMALVMGIIVTIYIFLFYLTIKKKFKLSNIESLLFAGFFFALHFIALNGSSTGHLFISINLCNYFYYLVPSIMGAILVMYFIYNDIGSDYRIKKLNASKLIKFGILIVLIYLCIFSNVTNSILFVSYVGTKLIINYIKSKNKNLVKFIINNRFYCLILVAWIISLIYTANGGRVSSVKQGITFSSQLKLVLDYFYTFVLLKIDRKFLILFVVSIISFIVVYFINKNTNKIEDNDKKYKETMIIAIFSTIITIAFLALILADSSEDYILRYIARGDVEINYFFYIIFAEITSLIYLTKKCNKLYIILPLLLFILNIYAVNYIITIYPKYALNTNPYNIATVKKIDYYIIEQFKKADENGEDYLELHVPKYGTSDNWPFASYAGNSISNTLYRAKVTSKLIKTKIIPDENVNEVVKNVKY